MTEACYTPRLHIRLMMIVVRSQRDTASRVATLTTQAPAVDYSQVGKMSDADRAALAKELGYLKIGKELPDDVTLSDIVKSMPKEVRNRLGGDGCATPALA